MNEISKLMVIREMVASNPDGWRKKIEKYIYEKPRDSYFLLAVFLALRKDLRYGFNSVSQNNDLGDLIGIALARHKTRVKRPKKGLIERASKAALKDDS